MNQLLTIVVPVYNRAKSVVATLDSIYASSCKSFELIVIDNGSSDDSLAVCQQWALSHRDDGFSVRVLSEPRRGASAARNRGLQACQTDYVYFFDSDDSFSDDFVSDVIPYLKTGSLDMLCVTVRQIVNGKAQTRHYRPCPDVHVHVLNSMLDTLSMVFRTDFLNAIGGWNENLTTWDDWELGVRALMHKPRLKWIEGKAYHQAVVHSNSQTGPNLSATQDAIAKAMQHVVELLKDVEGNAECGSKECSRALSACYLRCKIVAGQMRREGNKKGDDLFQQIATSCQVPHVNLQRLIGTIIYYYVCAGGRGAWWLALQLV